MTFKELLKSLPLPLSILVLFLNTLDLFTTYVGLKYFSLVELNPYFGVVQILFKITLFTILVPLSFAVQLNGNKWLCLGFTTFFVTCAVMFSYAVTNNIQLIVQRLPHLF